MNELPGQYSASDNKEISHIVLTVTNAEDVGSSGMLLVRNRNLEDIMALDTCRADNLQC